jgi:hypothetical protein
MTLHPQAVIGPGILFQRPEVLAAHAGAGAS